MNDLSKNLSVALTLTFSLLTLSLPAHAEIKEAASYGSPEVVLATQKLNGGKTWVIFDIDNTLLQPTTMMGTHQWGDYMRDQKMALGATREEAEAFQHAAFNEVQDSISVARTEDSVLPLIAQLSQKGVPTLALTARKVEIAERTLNQVASLGFNFKTTIPDLSAPDKAIHEGVVFSGVTPKGLVLKRLIAASKVKPTKIIFFDDRDYNLTSVEKELANTDIEFLGFRYGYMDKTVAAFRGDIANVEWLCFKQSRKAISDREALELVFSR